jgi:dolichyl-phosphate beta-glucosyltransferase
MIKTSEIDLSIIIPAYREADKIGDTLEQLAAFLATRDYGNVEVLVVTADAPDGTADIAQGKANLFKNFHQVRPGPRVGKGRDVRLGMLEALGSRRVFMDADLSTPLKHLDDVQRLMDEGHDVVIAVRDLIQIHKGFLRRFISKGGNLFIELLILPGIKDTQCGFKAFSAEAAGAIFSRQTMLGWSFDAEILLIARKLGYKIATFNAPDWHDTKLPGAGLTGDSPLKSAIKTLLDVVAIRWKAWTGVYKHPFFYHQRPTQ